MGFFDQLLGKDAKAAAERAAADQYAKQQAAAAETRAAGDNYQGALSGLSERFSPYANAGNSALARLLQGLGLAGEGGSEEFTRSYRALPGYQSALDQGSRQVTARLNAGPGIQSGAAMKALQRYGSDYEDQRSGDYLQRLMGLSTTGMGATQAGVNTAAQGYGGQLNARLGAANQMFGAAPTIGQGIVAGANAEAAGAQNVFNTGANLFGKLLGGGFGSSFGGSNVGYGTGPNGWTGNTGYSGWIQR